MGIACQENVHNIVALKAIFWGWEGQASGWYWTLNWHCMIHFPCNIFASWEKLESLHLFYIIENIISLLTAEDINKAIKCSLSQWILCSSPKINVTIFQNIDTRDIDFFFWTTEGSPQQESISLLSWDPAVFVNLQRMLNICGNRPKQRSWAIWTLCSFIGISIAGFMFCRYVMKENSSLAFFGNAKACISSRLSWVNKCVSWHIVQLKRLSC